MHDTQINKITARMDDRGFTFVELLVVIGIFSIGVLAVASMQITAIHANASARMSGEATAHAVNQIEALMTADYENSYELDADPDLNPKTLVRGAYTINWTVNDWDFDGDGNNDSKTVSVTVECANPKAKDVSMQYIIHEL